MSNLHQKKFYSSKETDEAIKKYAKKNGLGYSEAIRDMVAKFVSPAYVEYLKGPLDPRD